MNPPPGNIVAKLPYILWLNFRWEILLKLLQITTAENLAAAQAASRVLAQAERLVTVEWVDADPANRLAILPFDTWITFRWEIALNVIGVMDAANMAVAKEAVQILAAAESKVVAEWRPA